MCTKCIHPTQSIDNFISNSLVATQFGNMGGIDMWVMSNFEDDEWLVINFSQHV